MASEMVDAVSVEKIRLPRAYQRCDLGGTLWPDKFARNSAGGIFRPPGRPTRLETQASDR